MDYYVGRPSRVAVKQCNRTKHAEQRQWSSQMVAAHEAPKAMFYTGSHVYRTVEAQKQLDRIVALGYPDVADISAASARWPDL